MSKKKVNFEDILPQVDQIHYEVFESLLLEYFEIDTISSNVIVSHLLFKNGDFNSVRTAQVINMLYGTPDFGERVVASGPNKPVRKIIYD
jgi:hypothetical protein